MGKIICKDTNEVIEASDSKQLYLNYLQSNHWKQKRTIKAFKQKYKCERCGKDCKNNLEYNIHHKNYLRLGHEWISDLKFLCRECHQEVHSKFGNTKKCNHKYKKLRESRDKNKPQHRRKRCSTCINFEYAYNEKTRKCGYKCKITGKFAKTYKQLIQCGNYKKKAKI